MAEDENNSKNEIPEMNLNHDYTAKKPIIPNSDELQKSMDKTKKDIATALIKSNLLSRPYSQTSAEVLSLKRGLGG